MLEVEDIYEPQLLVFYALSSPKIKPQARDREIYPPRDLLRTSRYGTDSCGLKDILEKKVVDPFLLSLFPTSLICGERPG